MRKEKQAIPRNQPPVGVCVLHEDRPAVAILSATLSLVCAECDSRVRDGDGERLNSIRVMESVAEQEREYPV